MKIEVFIILNHCIHILQKSPNFKKTIPLKICFSLSFLIYFRPGAHQQHQILTEIQVMNDFFDIRDKSIKEGNVEELKKFLLPNVLKTWQVETLVGTALYHNQLNMIALLNLHIRENNIKMEKINVLEQVYYAKCRNDSSKRPKGMCVSYLSFNDYIKEHQMEEYWNVFETFTIRDNK